MHISAVVIYHNSFLLSENCLGVILGHKGVEVNSHMFLTSAFIEGSQPDL